MKKIIKVIAVLLAMVLLASCSENEENMQQTFEMKAIVENIGDRIEVNVFEAEYAEGIYWIITGEETEFYDSEGRKITRDDISPADTVEIIYNGQVMMSYPPQVVALKITVL